MGFYGTRSNMIFSMPGTMQSDFDNYLQTDVPGHTYNAVLNGQDNLRCAFHASGKAPGEKLLRVSVSTPIRTGDVIEIAGMGAYLIPEVARQVNCYASEPWRMNARITLTRKIPRQADALGRVTQQAGEAVVCENQLAYFTVKDEFRLYNVGAVAEGKPLFCLPLTEDTKKIRREDEFELDGERYSVWHVSYDLCDPERTRGILGLNCMRKAGQNS